MQTMINHKQRTTSYIEFINIHNTSEKDLINFHKNSTTELKLLDRIPYEKFMHLVDYSYSALIKTVTVMEPEIGECVAKRIESQLDEQQEMIFIKLREVYERIIVDCYNNI